MRQFSAREHLVIYSQELGGCSIKTPYSCIQETPDTNKQLSWHKVSRPKNARIVTQIKPWPLISKSCHQSWIILPLSTLQCELLAASCNNTHTVYENFQSVLYLIQWSTTVRKIINNHTFKWKNRRTNKVKAVYPAPPGPKGSWISQFSRLQNVMPNVYAYLTVPSNLIDTATHLTCHLISFPVFPAALSIHFS